MRNQTGLDIALFWYFCIILHKAVLKEFTPPYRKVYIIAYKGKIFNEFWKWP
jgi:hypothetical protein